MKCNQKTCSEDAKFRFTWPGNDEAAACEKHALVVEAVAMAIGLSLQMIPVDAEAPVKGEPGSAVVEGPGRST
jgi:hypothetical protein